MINVENKCILESIPKARTTIFSPRYETRTTIFAPKYVPICRSYVVEDNKNVNVMSPPE